MSIVDLFQKCRTSVSEITNLVGITRGLHAKIDRNGHDDRDNYHGNGCNDDALHYAAFVGTIVACLLKTKVNAHKTWTCLLKELNLVSMISI